MRLAPIVALLLAGFAGGGALAQPAPTDLNGRVTRIEKELRAVQRKVFPGAQPSYYDAEIAPTEAPPAAPGSPASSPLNDLTQRVDALERQLTTLTAQQEQDGFQLHQLQDQLAKFKADAELRLSNLEGKPNGAPPSPDAGAVASPPEPTPAPAAPKPALPPKPPAVPAASADSAEADYLAAYQFVRDSKYPEAETALKAYVVKYPKSKRMSYAQYWLGRSYLADNQPRLASEAFLGNYKINPRGDRAPDSLYWLGQSLMKLSNPAKACEAYAELLDVYGAKMSPALKDQTVKARAAANCGK